MAAKLVYLKLELKRAFKRLPHMAAGAIVLMAMLGTIAFAASKLLYGETTLERVTIGVVLPEKTGLPDSWCACWALTTA